MVKEWMSMEISWQKAISHIHYHGKKIFGEGLYTPSRGISRQPVSPGQISEFVESGGPRNQVRVCRRSESAQFASLKLVGGESKQNARLFACFSPTLLIYLRLTAQEQRPLLASTPRQRTKEGQFTLCSIAEEGRPMQGAAL